MTGLPQSRLTEQRPENSFLTPHPVILAACPPSRALRASGIRVVWWLHESSDLQAPPRGLLSYQELQALWNHEARRSGSDWLRPLVR